VLYWAKQTNQNRTYYSLIVASAPSILAEQHSYGAGVCHSLMQAAKK
jgi:hypothetical protein